MRLRRSCMSSLKLKLIIPAIPHIVNRL